MPARPLGSHLGIGGTGAEVARGDGPERVAAMDHNDGDEWLRTVADLSARPTGEWLAGAQSRGDRWCFGRGLVDDVGGTVGTPARWELPRRGGVHVRLERSAGSGHGRRGRLRRRRQAGWAADNRCADDRDADGETHRGLHGSGVSSWASRPSRPAT